MNVIIPTQRFNLVSITLSHVSVTYLGWLSSSHSYSRYIAGCSDSYTFADLANYVEQRSCRDDVLFLAIETKSGLHIGNIKYDPIDFNACTAEMGILIGNQDWIGRGVAGEVILASCLWLSKKIGVKKITLGVHPDNIGATLAYRKIGFVEVFSNPHNVRMELKI